MEPGIHETVDGSIRGSPVSRRAVRLGFIAALVGLACVTACRRQTESWQPDVLAQVGAQSISKDAFLGEWSRRVRSRDNPGRPVEKSQVLDDVILFEATYSKARSAGYEHHPEILAALKRMVVKKYQEDYQGKRKPVQPSEVELEAAYRENTSLFAIPEKRLAAVIFLRVAPTASSAAAEEIRARAEAIFAEAGTSIQAPETDGTSTTPGQSLRSFETLAQLYSEDQASRYQRGEIGWVSRTEKAGRYDEAVLNAIFAIGKPGELSPIVTTVGGLHLIKLLECRPSAVRPFREVKELVRQRLEQTREKLAREEFAAVVRKDVRILTNRVLFESISLPVPPAAVPPRIPIAAALRPDSRSTP